MVSGIRQNKWLITKKYIYGLIFQYLFHKYLTYLYLIILSYDVLLCFTTLDTKQKVIKIKRVTFISKEKIIRNNGCSRIEEKRMLRLYCDQNSICATVNLRCLVLRCAATGNTQQCCFPFLPREIESCWATSKLRGATQT